MKKLFIILLLIQTSVVFGQGIMGPYWLYDNHYLTDKYIINPAFAGKQNYPKVFISTQRMDMQMRESPNVHIAAAHGRFGIKQKEFKLYGANAQEARNAMGGLLFADNNGPFQTIGIKLDYTYTVPLDTRYTYLSFGLGGMLFSKRIKMDKYNTTSPDDPLIAENMGKHSLLPDINAGALLYNRQFYAGFSVSQLLENSYMFSNISYTAAQVYRNYYLMTGYRFEYDKFDLEPSIVVGHNFAPEGHGNNGNFVDVNVECFLKPMSFALSYRIDGYISSSLLYRDEKIEMGVRMELFPTNSFDARLGSIALMASYSFSKSKR